MRAQPLRIIGKSAAALVMLGATSARAEAPVVARRIWIAVEPWTCARETAPFARHVQLACDSMAGGCEVAASEDHATERAVLSCDAAAPWTIALRKLDGTTLLSASLDGDREQRLRKAAMWAARADFISPLPPTPRATLPEAPPVLAVPPDTARSPELTAPSPSSYREDGRTGPDAIEPRRGPKSASLTFSAFYGPTNAENGGYFLGGGRAALGFLTGKRFFVGPAFDYAVGLEGRSRGNLYLAGATLGWGAPFEQSWFGLSLDLGGGASSRGAGRDRGDMPLPARVAGTAYGRVAMTVRFPVNLPMQPTVTLAGMHVTDQFGDMAQTAALDLGLVWPTW